MKAHWTFAAGSDGFATLHQHRSRDAAISHYSRMRTIGGPKRIGRTNAVMTQERAIEGVEASGLKVANIVCVLR